MTEANTRGEVTITLDGAEYVMRPTYEAIQAIEEKTGMGLLGLLNLIGNGEMSQKKLAVIVTELIKAWGKAGGESADPIRRGAAGSNADKIAHLIYEAGVSTAMGRVSVVLVGALSGGVTASGEWKPALTTETQDAD